ncbi:hypothetical protein PUN28_019332 [Cardiocondyla obscurior]|uniref:Uncharacterized protein n=1 Tax=Cardiocondyla obscurior TaxID=286306 RepID=A0AAW2EGV2_9HYME
MKIINKFSPEIRIWKKIGSDVVQGALIRRKHIRGFGGDLNWKVQLEEPYVRNFTQFVWKSSKFMDTDIVTDPDWKARFACRFDLTANIYGELVT